MPGLYGEKNVKWVTGIEVIDHDGKGFYEAAGMGTELRHPDPLRHLLPAMEAWPGRRRLCRASDVNQTMTIRGRAFAGDRGVKTVEFSDDEGKTWSPNPNRLPRHELTWTFWSAHGSQTKRATT